MIAGGEGGGGRWKREGLRGINGNGKNTVKKWLPGLWGRHEELVGVGRWWDHVLELTGKGHKETI